MSSTTTVPPRTLQQRASALERANRVRTFRARLKEDVKAGRKTAYGIVACPPEFTQTMHIFDLLLATPKLGRVKANRLLRHCAVAPSKTLGSLSERQRVALLAGLPR